MLAAQAAHWSDLDGPLLLAKDREPGLSFRGPLILPPSPELWG
jgi:L-Ala-D/L-Glu epimerase